MFSKPKRNRACDSCRKKKGEFISNRVLRPQSEAKTFTQLAVSHHGNLECPDNRSDSSVGPLQAMAPICPVVVVLPASSIQRNAHTMILLRCSILLCNSPAAAHLTSAEGHTKRVGMVSGSINMVLNSFQKICPNPGGPLGQA